MTATHFLLQKISFLWLFLQQEQQEQRASF
jgi:hypothetical protein